MRDKFRGVFAALILVSSSGQAHAQWGWGIGLYNPENAGVAAEAVNKRSQIREQAAYSNRPSSLVAPGIVSRDDSFYDKYDLATREAMIDRVARDPSREISTAGPGARLPRSAPPVPRTAPASILPAPTPRAVLLGNFFDKDRRLVWPPLTPSYGDLATKREIADQAALAVLDEYQKTGVATMATTVDARNKIVAFGQPALAYVREHSTPAVSDSFHAFLLSLYRDVGDAYTIPMSQRK